MVPIAITMARTTIEKNARFLNGDKGCRTILEMTPSCIDDHSALEGWNLSSFYRQLQARSLRHGLIDVSTAYACVPFCIGQFRIPYQTASRNFHSCLRKLQSIWRMPDVSLLPNSIYRTSDPVTRGPDDILQVTRSLGCLQLDPISAVAPSHLIVLWNRLGVFDTSELDKLLWSEKKLFEYWAHQASIVLMEDYPLHYYMMRGYPDVFLKALGPVWRLRVKKWLGANSDLRNYVLTELKQKGPLLSRQFEDKTRAKSRGFGWSSWSGVSRMLAHLFFKGEVMVVGRQGKQKLWDISERFLPNWVSKRELSEQEVEYEAVQRSLRALGTANESELSWHFLRGRYRNLKDTLKQLEAESKIQTVDFADGPVGKGVRYIHSEDIPVL